MEPTFGFQEEVKELKHSGPGIASFIISLVCIILLVVLFGVALISESGELALDEEEAMYLVLGLVGIIDGILNIIGVGLGIFGIVQKNRKRVFPIIGLIINGTLLLFFIYLFI
ncbi:DUF6142 family protein [Vallitalea okinawensis]|uniref:DUF6142 family protein n=1 Tax=Vallitalea okinawensis TaxID=2078660 RepID=UPI000CFDB93D|nr:DUF6142 family protein [Vallitalea okinawensis]